MTDTTSPLWPEGLSDISVYTVVTYPTADSGRNGSEQAARSEASAAEMAAGAF